MTEKEKLLDSVYEVNEGLLNEKRNPPLERKKAKGCQHRQKHAKGAAYSFNSRFNSKEKKRYHED